VTGDGYVFHLVFVPSVFHHSHNLHSFTPPPRFFLRQCHPRSTLAFGKVHRITTKVVISRQNGDANRFSLQMGIVGKVRENILGMPGLKVERERMQ
jgi:hypothetical protein